MIGVMSLVRSWFCNGRFSILTIFFSNEVAVVVVDVSRRVIKAINHVVD